MRASLLLDSMATCANAQGLTRNRELKTSLPSSRAHPDELKMMSLSPSLKLETRGIVEAMCCSSEMETQARRRRQLFLCQVCFSHRSTRCRLCSKCHRRRALPSCRPQVCWIAWFRMCKDCWLDHMREKATPSLGDEIWLRIWSFVQDDAWVWTLSCPRLNELPMPLYFHDMD